MSGGAFHQPSSDEANEAARDGQQRYLFLEHDHAESERYYRDQERGARSAGRAKLAGRRGHQDVGDGPTECAECEQTAERDRRPVR